MPGENLEKVEIKSYIPAVISSNEIQERQLLMNTNSSYIDWNNPQLLPYMLEFSFGGENKEESSVSDSIVGWSQI